MQIKCIILLFFFFQSFFFCQIRKDTTFTAFTEYKKNSKKYPFIKIVFPENPTSINKISQIIYDHSTSRPLHLDAFICNSEEKLPAILIIHGGGWKSGTKEMQTPMAEKLALNKYQVFTIEYRLSDEAKYPAGIDDVLNAIKFIKKNSKKFKIKQNQITVLGISSGAQMASLIGTKYPKSVNAVINIDGVLAFHHPDSEEGKVAALWLGGTFEEIPEIWEEASALTHVSKKTPPFLFITSQYKRFTAGKNDMINKLNKFGIYSVVQNIENSPHAFWLFHPWFDPTIKYITQFLNYNFKNKK